MNRGRLPSNPFCADCLAGDARSRRLGRLKQGVCVMFFSWMNLEMVQLVELLTASLVAMASTCSWLFLSAR